MQLFKTMKNIHKGKICSHSQLYTSLYWAQLDVQQSLYHVVCFKLSTLTTPINYLHVSCRIIHVALVYNLVYFYRVIHHKIKTKTGFTNNVLHLNYILK